MDGIYFSLTEDSFIFILGKRKKSVKYLQDHLELNKMHLEVRYVLFFKF